jgi:hypothetical protein
MFEYERVRVEGDVGWSETERDVRQGFTVREKRRSQISQKSHDDDDYDNKERLAADCDFSPFCKWRERGRESEREKGMSESEK